MIGGGARARKVAVVCGAIAAGAAIYWIILAAIQIAGASMIATYRAASGGQWRWSLPWMATFLVACGLTGGVMLIERLRASAAS